MVGLSSAHTTAIEELHAVHETRQESIMCSEQALATSHAESVAELTAQMTAAQAAHAQSMADAKDVQEAMASELSDAAAEADAFVGELAEVEAQAYLTSSAAVAESEARLSAALAVEHSAAMEAQALRVEQVAAAPRSRRLSRGSQSIAGHKTSTRPQLSGSIVSTYQWAITHRVTTQSSSSFMAVAAQARASPTNTAHCLRVRVNLSASTLMGTATAGT